jgi:Ca2+-binding RTX toxin-like protein
VVTATNADGSASAESNPTPLVSSNIPTNTALPTITENVSSTGSTTSYSATRGTWNGAEPIAYKFQWRRCDANGANCRDIAAGVAMNYTPAAADLGSRLRVAVTASNSFGQATAVSEPTELIAGTAPVNSFRPSISGTERAGSSLAASPGSWTGSAPITYTYEWRRCNATGGACAAISGATSSSYIVQNGDVGSTIMVAVTARNSAGTATALSDVTDVIAAGTTGSTTATRPSNTRAPSFTGVLARGRTLTAVSGTWSGTTPMTFSYQWQRCPATGTACTPIALATRSTYVLAAADVNRRIRLLVTAGNVAGSTQALSAISVRVAARAPAASRGRTIRGNAGANRLTGTNFADTIHGLGGNDIINPRGGRDRVFAGAGNDTIAALDGAKDTIDCGSGRRDRVTADRMDTLRGCERVTRRTLAIRGNARANRLTGTNGPDTIYGMGGNDTIDPRGGRDSVSGGPGNDTINAADGLRDRVDCGSGRDHVIADPIDFVTRCERITIRRR